MKHAQGWEEKVVFRASAKPGVNADAQIHELCIRLVRREHTRAVRVVKAQLKAAQLNQHRWLAHEKEGYLSACNDILHMLQRGRGEKG